MMRLDEALLYLSKDRRSKVRIWTERVLWASLLVSVFTFLVTYEFPESQWSPKNVRLRLERCAGTCSAAGLYVVSVDNDGYDCKCGELR
jgi:hypothetical protein